MSTGPDPIAIFRAEADELFEQLEAVLLDMETDPCNDELVNTAFRAMHTIKGSGAMFGFEAVASFTHHMENAFDLVRKGQLPVTQALIELALDAKDHMRSLIEAPDKADMELGEAILTRLSAIIGAKDHTEAKPKPPVAVAVPLPAKPKPAPTHHKFRIRFRLAQEAMKLGTNPLPLLAELRGLGECAITAHLEDVPSLDDIDPSACYLRWTCELITDKPRDAIDDVFLFVIDDMELEVTEAEDVVEDVPPEPLEPVQQKAPQQPAKSPSSPPEKVERREEPGIRVQAERLDALIDQVGELVIAQARLRQFANSFNDPHLKSLVEEIERLSSELRDTTMGIRMVPIGALFTRFRRLVRDLSRDLGKEIGLTTSGEETELDKTVIERLHDPLIHLIRNSLDHGIGMPDEREAGGKPRQGTIHLSASHSGPQVLISITDDGRGMDPARIRAKAEETGLIAPGAELSNNELFHLIFEPGFSTASTVTNVSGRGVGMDVVKRTIDSLRGSIDIESVMGKGTTMTLRLPLTLAIIDGLLVRIGHGRYVIPLSAVEECVELTTQEDCRTHGRDFLDIRDEVVPFLRLKSLFNVTGPENHYPKVVIVSTSQGRVGFAVDQIIGDHQTVIKSLSKIHSNVKIFSGATILGDGSVALILDVPRLIDFGQVNDNRLKSA